MSVGYCASRRRAKIAEGVALNVSKFTLKFYASRFCNRFKYFIFNSLSADAADLPSVTTPILPSHISGSSVAMHRAVHLAQSNPSARVLLTTFSDVLANALQNRLRLLLANRRLHVHERAFYSSDARAYTEMLETPSEDD
ncbi:MAG: UvrD/REP helicase [Edaphobacter sp.]|nr:UvrD/REP helicase [Edaphobacter sp.]